MKYTLATVVGLLLFSIIATIISIVSIAGMVASEGVATTVEKNSILRIPLRGSLVERSEDGSLPFDPTTILMGGETENISLEEALTALEKAAENKNVVGIYLEAGAFGGTPAMVEELHDALVKFKKESGKWIMAYGDTYSKSAYYLSSVADTIMLNPQGGVDWSGMASQLYFLKDMLEKVGVKMQVFKVGTYKSAVEPFICSEMSEANREQVTQYITGIWQQMLTDVSASRKISKEQLNAYADSITMFNTTAEYQKQKLIDKALYYDQVKPEIRKLLKIDADKDINTIGISSMLATEGKKNKGEEVAVYYAYGNIVTQEAQNQIMGGGHSIVGVDVAEDLVRYHWDLHQERFHNEYVHATFGKARISVIKGFDEGNSLENFFLDQKQQDTLKKIEGQKVEEAVVESRALTETGKQLGSPVEHRLVRRGGGRWYVVDYAPRF